MCKNSYNINFNSSKRTSKDKKNIHQAFNDNDCYLDYKYVYEYVSNYDFDEFIFPRQDFSPSQSRLLNSSKNMISKPNYDINKYTKYLHDLFGGKNISSLHFVNTFMLIDNRNLLDNILNYMYDKVSNQSIEYKERNSSAQFRVNKNDTEIIDKFWKRVIPLIDSLNETNRLRSIRSNGRNSFFFNTKWNNAYGFRWFYGRQKCIYVTDNALTIGTHYTRNFLKGTKNKVVPFNYGFLSHFRGDYDLGGDKELIDRLSFNRLQYDIEYYLFYSSLFV